MTSEGQDAPLAEAKPAEAKPAEAKPSAEPSQVLVHHSVRGVCVAGAKDATQVLARSLRVRITLSVSAATGIPTGIRTESDAEKRGMMYTIVARRDKRGRLRCSGYCTMPTPGSFGKGSEAQTEDVCRFTYHRDHILCVAKRPRSEDYRMSLVSASKTSPTEDLAIEFCNDVGVEAAVLFWNGRTAHAYPVERLVVVADPVAAH